ncbi:GNAT family N-acetyltransferase [Actinomycetospora callitridis]|uniref:GNAT family N-acetyltransferase n=1 Tax=Actinomycetospora callitridis TaxID=913944 RepID=UPI002365BCA1|nr:GNAT family N-acetyltransferase [Actinomycetospora callitridis]MDD7917703.1 GNAT family N-acetyltransferase [Actinomycetospora callitridis]
MRVDVVGPDELTADEVDRWRVLQTKTPPLRTPFLSPEFTRVVGEFRPRTRVGVLTDGGEIVGFFPFERATLGRGLPVAPGLSDAQGLVHAPDVDWDARELVRSCGLSVWEFDHLVADQRPFDDYRTSQAASPVIDLTDGFEAYHRAARARSSRVRDLPRRARRLERDHGPLRFVLEAGDDTAVAALDTVLGWKSAQYQRTGRSDRFARPWIRGLVHELLGERTGPFRGCLSLLYAGDELVAGHFGLRDHGVVPTWFPAYSARMARYSPGLLLHLAMARAAAADGVELIDMGRGAKTYKDELKSGDTTVAEGRVARPVPTAALAWARTAPVRSVRRAVDRSPQLYGVADRVLRARGRWRRPGQVNGVSA